MAIKIICRDEAPSVFRQRFLPREIEILSFVQHPHIVKVHEIFETKTPPRVYIVTEYSHGGDLLEYVKVRFLWFLLALRNSSLVQCFRHCRGCGRSGVQFLGQANWTQCPQRIANAAMFLWSCLAGPEPRRYALPLVTRFGVMPREYNGDLMIFLFLALLRFSYRT